MINSWIAGFRYELETRLLYLPPDEVIVISKSENILTMKILKSIDDNLKTTRVNIPEDTLESWKHILGDDALELYSVNYSLPLQQCFVSLLEYLSRLNVANMLSIHDNVTLFNDSKSIWLFLQKLSNHLNCLPTLLQIQVLGHWLIFWIAQELDLVTVFSKMDITSAY